MMLKRFSCHQRLAHFVGSISGMMLLITGLPITFSNQLRWVIDLFGGSAVTMFLHRLFAMVLIFSFVYFGVYFILERLIKGRGDSNIRLSPKFVLEVISGTINDLLWTFGLRKERPKFGKYDWIMVADIISMPILALIEIVTGTIMWFPAMFSFITENPGLFFAVRAIHAGVAFFLVLFVLAHAGILHLTPGNFPINMAIFSGLMPKKKAEHEHPEWVPMAEAIEKEEKEYRFHPIGYVFGAITIVNVILLAYVPFIMHEEGFAGLRIGDSLIASIGLNLAMLTLIAYVIVSICAIIKGARS
jgi:cytochrome b subunit of formate dehydrogenase